MHRSLGREKGSTLDKGCQSQCQKDHNWMRNRLGWNVLDCSSLFKEHCRTDEMSSILVSSQSLAGEEEENDFAEVEKGNPGSSYMDVEEEDNLEEDSIGAPSWFDPMVKKNTMIFKKNISTPDFFT